MKKILLLSILFVVGCEKSSTNSDSSVSSGLVGTWNMTSFMFYENATCTGEGEDALAEFWTNVAVTQECNSTACTRSIILTCSGCAEGSTDECCSEFGGDTVMNESTECEEILYSLSGTTVTFTSNSYCGDCTSADEATCEANDEDWVEADTITAAVTGNTFIIEDGSEEECDDETYANEADCEAGESNWESSYCEIVTFTKQ